MANTLGYDFTLSERVKLMRIDRMKKDTVDVLSRANMWANDKEIMKF